MPLHVVQGGRWGSKQEGSAAISALVIPDAATTEDIRGYLDRLRAQLPTIVHRAVPTACSMALKLTTALLANVGDLGERPCREQMMAAVQVLIMSLSSMAFGKR
jgi:hypothetical protein